jgi:hypothetical protein
VSWGQKEIQYLRENKAVIIRALSFDWVKQMFIMSPSQGRRLWFEVISFSTPSPLLHSQLCSFKGTEIDAFYRTDFYEVPGIVAYTDYLQLVNSVEQDLTNAGYKVTKQAARSEEIKMELPNGMIGGGVISKPVNVEDYRSLLPQDSLASGSDYVQLDEHPESLFTLAYKSMLEVNQENGD